MNYVITFNEVDINNEHIRYCEFEDIINWCNTNIGIENVDWELLESGFWLRKKMLFYLG